ncbi:hypothetical protein B296_00024272 [Ensete ventricosum]|uniref:Uncharacterized protein n=2 Tax=Ensete ventricosum TaxID=4639 RepID=A0A427AVM5_ENSVE|nr:hypothetical protein B296_00024272 [Ensete ventricosum]
MVLCHRVDVLVSIIIHRYSTMLAENLVDVHYSSRTEDVDLKMEQDAHVEECKSTDTPVNAKVMLVEVSSILWTLCWTYELRQQMYLIGGLGVLTWFSSITFSEDDECTIEEDEAQITEEERREELTALKAEADLPLEELLKFYVKDN